MKKTLLWSVLLLIMTLVFIFGSTNKNNIVIGAVIPQTGFGAYWGGPVLKGIELARKDIKKYYPNLNIHIKIEDSKSDTASAVSAAKKLLNIDKADALYTEFSGASSAISPIAKEANKILVYSTFNQKIAEDNQTSLKTFVSYDTVCESFGKHINNSKSKILIVSSIGDTAPYCVRGLKKYVDKDNIKVVEGFKGNDFRTLLLQNKEFNPNYILPIMYEDGSFALIKQKYELGLKDINLFCNKQDCASNKILTSLPAASTENIMYFEASIDQNFVSKIKNLYPDISDDDIQAAANSYQSMMVIADGMNNCKDKDALCIAKYVGNKEKFKEQGYTALQFKDRILQSEVRLGIVKEGKLVNLK